MNFGYVVGNSIVHTSTVGICEMIFIEGEKGMFIAMPSKKSLDGEYRDIAHPINSATRERIQTTILNRYEEAMEEEEEAAVVDEM